MLELVFVKNAGAAPFYVWSEVPTPHPHRAVAVRVDPGECKKIYLFKPAS